MKNKLINYFNNNLKSNIAVNYSKYKAKTTVTVYIICNHLNLKFHFKTFKTKLVRSLSFYRKWFNLLGKILKICILVYYSLNILFQDHQFANLENFHG